MENRYDRTSMEGIIKIIKHTLLETVKGVQVTVKIPEMLKIGISGIALCRLAL